MIERLAPLALLLAGNLVAQAPHPPIRTQVATAPPSICASDMPLGPVIDQGRTTARRKKKPRKAITEYIQPCLNTIAFQRAPIAYQEVFMFEYLQACQLAAKNEVRDQYYAEAARVASFYLTWYPPRERQLPPEFRRVTIAAFQLGDAYAELLDWSALLREYTKIARANPQYLADERSLLSWFKALRTEGVTIPRNVAEVRSRITDEPDHRGDWQLFRDTAQALKRDRRYGKDLRDALSFAEKVLK